MILKFRIGLTDWILIDGFEQLHHFYCEEIGAESKPGQGTECHYRARTSPDSLVGSAFSPIDHCFYTNEAKRIPCMIGIIGLKNNQEIKYLIDSDDIFILNNDGKTIERI